MEYVKDFLNKIKWDKRLKGEEFTIIYFDRVENKKIEIKFKDIKVEGNFMVVDESSIPLHRIREIKRNGKIVWKRG